jgi:hypothetical protein
MTTAKMPLILTLFFLIAPAIYADQGSFTNSGGTSGGTIVSNVSNPAGNLCISGNNLTFFSLDGTMSIVATFTSLSNVESCSGGGKGGNVHCGYTLNGTFSGTLTLNGAVQAINGTTYQSYAVGGAPQGTTAYNSAYTPFYFSNSGQILRSDDLNGTNLISYGTQGSGIGQFYGANGIAVDSAGRIYVADTYNGRVVRFDDMNGTNWTSFGTWGSDVGQFMDLSGITIDPSGRIYVVDAGNNRLVRMDDMNGTNWTSVSAISSAPVAFDSSGRLYFADAGNRQIVRMDDMNGTNLTTLSQSPAIGIYIYTFASPLGVAVDSSNRIYVLDGSSTASVIRVNDMTGANWTSISLGSAATPHSIAVDASGMVLVGGGGAQVVDNMGGVSVSSSALTQFYGPYYVFGATPVPLPTPRPSAISFTPAALTFSQNTGTNGSQAVTIANFGDSTLNLGNISVTGGFTDTSNCPGSLAGGSNCTVNVTFAPSVTGTATGLLTVTDDSFNLGTTQSVALTGTGTAPFASVSPASLSFSSQIEGTTSNARTVTLTNTGTGPLQVSTVTVTAPFSQTNTCSASVAPAASCTISVSFAPTAVGSFSGTLTIAGNAGTQTVSLTGNGSAQVTVSSSSLSFGTLAVGNTSAAKTVTLTNRASVAFSVTSVGASTGFTVATNTCGASVAAGASCVVGVTFSPTSVGTTTGSLTFTDTALNSPQTVSLSGTGSAPVTVSPASLSFSNTAAGGTSSAKTVTVTNNQNVAFSFTGIATTSGFAVASNTCGSGIAAGASCTVGVTFSPTVTGTTTGTLTLANSAPNSPQTVSLSGTATGAAAVTVSPGSLNFGAVIVGKTSAAGTVTLKNAQRTGLSLTSVTASTGFAVASNTCGTSIATGASCTIGVTFSPTVTGAASGTLTFKDNAPNSPQTVSLSGTGSAAVTLSAGSLNLGTATVGTTSVGQTVTVTNTGTTAVSVNSVTATGDFADTTNCSSLTSGNSCSVSVSFTPVLAGTRTGTLTVNLSAGALTASLTGTGVTGSGGGPGVLTLSVPIVTFSGYTIGDNPSQNVTVTNGTGNSVGIAGIAMSGDASLTEKNTCGTVVAAGASCTITVTFKPVAYGTFTTTVTVTEGSGATDTVAVSGTSSPDS